MEFNCVRGLRLSSYGLIPLCWEFVAGVLLDLPVWPKCWHKKGKLMDRSRKGKCVGEVSSCYKWGVWGGYV